MMNSLKKVVLVSFLLSSLLVKAMVYHVSKDGDDGNDGTEVSPFLSVSKAAEVAVAGDTVLIHSGTYREYVNPQNSGEAGLPIVYKNFENDIVYIKGSEVIENWKRINTELWQVKIPNSFFGDYNPYLLNVDGDFQLQGQQYHRGEVYINHKKLKETRSSDLSESNFFWKVDDLVDSVLITANFAGLDPNINMTEINVRELLFFPTKGRIDYIVVDGLHFYHAAPNWQAPNDGGATPNITQVGAVGSKMGKGWVIQNCEVSFSKTAGIMMGESFTAGVAHSNLDLYGGHTVQNNIITNCGEYGIAGQKGFSRSLIKGNLIEDINTDRLLGGFETAGLKVWNCTDLTIESNVIRRVYKSNYSVFGMWIDYANQGTRITRNIVYDNSGDAIWLEANFGPNLLDNNIFVGNGSDRGIDCHSGGTILAHNLLYRCHINYGIQYFDQVSGGEGRGAYVVNPHTAEIYLFTNVQNVYNKVYNNIIAGFSTSSNFFAYSDEGGVINNNLYMEGAPLSPGGTDATESDASIDFNISETPTSATVSFTMDDSFQDMNTPLVTNELIGRIPLPRQGIEDQFGNPITVNGDYDLSMRDSTPTVGPIEDLVVGENVLDWSVSGFAYCGSSFELTVDVVGEGAVNTADGVYGECTLLTLIPQAASGYRFSHWTGDIESEEQVFKTYLYKDLNITAVFVEKDAMQLSFNGWKLQIPGIIEAEYFDEGGESVAYHDDTIRAGDTVYRASETVDIYKLTDGYAVGTFAKDEWMEYTVDVKEGIYDIEFYVGSTVSSGAKLSFYLDDELIDEVEVENTNSVSSFAKVELEAVHLNAMEDAVLKILAEEDTLHIDKVIFEYIQAQHCVDGVQSGDEDGVDCGGSCADICVGVLPIINFEIRTFPNPVRAGESIVFDSEELLERVELVDQRGQVVASLKPESTSFQFPVSKLNTGMYLLKAFADGRYWSQKIVVE